MYIRKKFYIEDISTFKQQCLHWASSKAHFCYLNGNNCPYPYESFPDIIAVGSKETFSVHPVDFVSAGPLFSKKGWHFGFWGYDMGRVMDGEMNLGFPPSYFFCASTVIHFVSHKTVEVISDSSPEEILSTIKKTSLKPKPSTKKPSFKATVSQKEYIQQVERLKLHLNRGDIYQINYCIRFDCDHIELDILALYQQLTERSPMPFSGIFRCGDTAIISASPERYLKKMGNKLISQPMKGTSARSSNAEEDNRNKRLLLESPKERAENIMIVDLVRNDLSKISLDGTVRVEELCNVYSFPQVHQMISTVVCEVDPSLPSMEAFMATFPMGSMTGAPKIRAMELIDAFEVSPRGPFSGALGYIDPDGNFDFNVLIRSVFYNRALQKAFYAVGSGITSLSEPTKEYQECLLKASALQQIFLSEA